MQKNVLKWYLLLDTSTLLNTVYVTPHFSVVVFWFVLWGLFWLGFFFFLFL